MCVALTPHTIETSDKKAQQIATTPAVTNKSESQKPKVIFDGKVLPLTSCGDTQVSEAWWPVFIDGGNLNVIRAEFCKDAVVTKRQDTGANTVQLASFSSSNRAISFATLIGGEVGQPSYVRSKTTTGTEGKQEQKQELEPQTVESSNSPAYLQNPSIAASPASLSRESTARHIGDYFESKYNLQRDIGTQYVRSPEDFGIITLRNNDCQLDVTGARYDDPASLDERPSEIHFVNEGNYFNSTCAEILQEVLAIYIPKHGNQVFSQATAPNALTQWREYQQQHNFEQTILFKNSDIEITAIGVLDSEAVAIDLKFQS